MSRIIGFSVLVVLATATTIFPFVAHAELNRISDRSAFDVSPEQPVLTLTFGKDLDLTHSTIEIIDGANRSVSASGLYLASGGSDVTVPLRRPLTPGTYTIKWHMFGLDGSESQGASSLQIAP